MLATLAKGLHAPADAFVYEVKYDGYRALAAISGGRSAVKSRNDLDFSTRFPWVVPALRQVVVGEAVLDGELVALDSHGVSRFQMLGDPAAEHRYSVFDLLWLDGQDLRQRPLEERRELLESVMANTQPPLELAERVAGTEEQALAEAKKRHWEGLLAKRRGSPYVGTRSTDWLKLKVFGTDELVIAGWTPISNGSPEVGALLVATRKGDRYVYAGKVGTGLDRATRRRLLTLLRKDEAPSPLVDDAPRMRDARWVKPRLVAQLSFTEWTRDGRLRHPSFQGLREDKGAEDIAQDAPEARASAKRKGAASKTRGSGSRRAPERKSPAARTRPSARASDTASATRKAAKGFSGKRAAKDSAPKESPSATVGFFGSAPTGKVFGTWHSNRSDGGQPAKEQATPAPKVEVPITHPEKALFPKTGITKAAVRAYDDGVAAELVAALDGRPLSFQQWPQGIGGPGIFRHNATGAPEWVRRITVQHVDHSVEHIVVDRPETVSWLANQSALTLHMTSSRAATVDQPDWVAFDFDPGDEGWKSVPPLAQALRGLLEELRLVAVPKTSGKRGLHVLVPIAAGHTHEQALAFAEAVTGALADRFPALGTTERSIKKRKGRLYLDAFQNGRLKTMVAPYSIRAVEGAPVSTPLAWDEVDERLNPGDFNIGSLPARLAKIGDLFAPALRGGQRLPELRS